jgi:hypothetical protein
MSNGRKQFHANQKSNQQPGMETFCCPSTSGTQNQGQTFMSEECIPGIQMRRCRREIMFQNKESYNIQQQEAEFSKIFPEQRIPVTNP